MLGRLVEQHPAHEDRRRKSDRHRDAQGGAEDREKQAGSQRSTHGHHPLTARPPSDGGLPDSASMGRILVIEDDEGIAEPLAAALRRDGHDVRAVGCVADVELAVLEHQPELVVLDLGLPDGDGIDVCRLIRTESPDVEILILTGRRDELDTVEALDAGADDYVTKPFRLAELLARVRARLRSAAAVDLRVNDLHLDLEGRRAWQGTTELHFSVKEFGVLAELARRPGVVVTREQLMDAVWGPNWFGPTKTLDVHVAWLRKKLGDDVAKPRYIATIRGVGYRLERSS